MANLKLTLASGAEVEIQKASFEKAHALLQASRISTIPSENIIDLILTAPVQAALWPCMGVCLYNGKKIVPELFDDEKAREDYLVILKAVFEENVAPFFRGLASELEKKQAAKSSPAQA